MSPLVKISSDVMSQVKNLGLTFDLLLSLASHVQLKSELSLSSVDHSVHAAP